jgi:DNA-binding MarR family transcriptional regulator
MARPDHAYCTCEGLRRLTRRMTVVYDRHLAEAGLTVGQYSLLVNIGAETLPLSRLARRTATDRSTLTRLLVPLVKAGWVVVLPGEDARTRQATLTDAGRHKAKTAQACGSAAGPDRRGAAAKADRSFARHDRRRDDAATAIRR